MSTYHRKTTPREKGGRVQKKNNWEEAPNYYNTFQVVPVLDRKRPGLGHHHDVVTTKKGGIPNRGEAYAEWYARRYRDTIFERYCKVFPEPS